MITQTCCYYCHGDLCSSPLLQHGALDLDRQPFHLTPHIYLSLLSCLFVLLISPFGTFQKWQISACGGILVNGATNLCIGESYQFSVFMFFSFRFGAFQQWVFLSRREGFAQPFLYLFRASSFLVLIFCDDVLRASLYLVSYAQWKNEERDLCMSHSLDARLHLNLHQKRSALLDAGSMFLTPDRVIVSYKIEWCLLVC